MTEAEAIEDLIKIYLDLAASQEPLGHEFEAALADNIESLYEA